MAEQSGDKGQAGQGMDKHIEQITKKYNDDLEKVKAQLDAKTAELEKLSDENQLLQSKLEGSVRASAIFDAPPIPSPPDLPPPPPPPPSSAPPPPPPLASGSLLRC